MTTRSDPKIRLFFVVAAIAVTTGLLVMSVALRDREAINNRSKTAETTEFVKTNWDPGESHPLTKPTQFYSTTLVEDPPTWNEVAYTDDQISRESILYTLLHHDGDLLGDQSFNAVRELVTNDQLFEAKMVAREFDAQLKEIRRERAQILENVGVTIDDPTEALEKVRIKAFYLFSQVRTRILQEVLTADQRRAISTKFKAQRLAAQANAERLKAEEESAN